MGLKYSLENVPTLTAIPAIIDRNTHWCMYIGDIQHRRIVYTEISGIGKETASTYLPGSMSIDQRYLTIYPPSDAV
jgi:hypothetical protein